MGVLVVIAVFFSLLVQACAILYCTRIEKTLLDLLDAQEATKKAAESSFKKLRSEIKPPASVTDPFKKRKPVYSSTSHIVVPKTATEIRNQNFEKIKKGEEYGYIH